jgi:hypothetical protein
MRAFSTAVFLAVLLLSGCPESENHEGHNHANHK